MLTFKQYLVEARNTHMEHLEDAIFNMGSKGINQSIILLNSLTKMLSSSGASKKVAVSTKWDGAPAVFCGINPENGKFFVATKSLFNKSPKINYTNADIDANHEGGLADKLKICLKELPKLGIKTIYQGDLMFTPEDLLKKEIDGEEVVSFQPNTIVYAVPSKSDFAKTLKRAKMGIVFHTEYTGKTISDLSASYKINLNKLKKTKDVWYDDAFLKDYSGSATFTTSERKKMEKLNKAVRDSIKGFPPKFLDEIQKNKQLFDMLKIYTNQRVRAGVDKNTVPMFIESVYSQLQKKIDKLKSEKGKQKKIAHRDEVIQYIRDNASKIKKVFEMHYAITQAKLYLVRKLEKVGGIKTFVRDGDGFKIADPEGFVAISSADGSAMKLVDRLTFSKNNFDPTLKAWSK